MNHDNNMLKMVYTKRWYRMGTVVSSEEQANLLYFWQSLEEARLYLS